jgi:hypothetical protein
MLNVWQKSVSRRNTMADFGVLSAIRDMLKMQLSTDDHQIGEHIH